MEQGAGRRSIVLTGFMGTGKSTVGRVLAPRLGFELVDTDAVIEARHGPIPTIFAEHGEEAFRAHERELAGELAGRDGLVIATGGRMMLDPGVRAALEGADVVCLVASVDTILTRIAPEGPPGDRPLLAGGEPRGRVAALLAERRDGYARFTPVATDGRTPEEVAEAVVEALGRDDR